MSKSFVGGGGANKPNNDTIEASKSVQLLSLFSSENLIS